MLGDCHIHMILDGVYYKNAIAAHRAAPVESIIRERLEGWHTAKITFLRDGGDAFGVGLMAARLAAEYGIDYRSPAFPIHKKGHYGAFIGRGWADMEEYRALVSEAKCSGADFIKIMISGLMDFGTYGKLSEEPLTDAEIKELIRIAHGEGMAVMAHANGSSAVLAAAGAGVDSVEHGAYLNDEALHAVAESGAVWVPTLVTIGNLIGCGRFPDKVLEPLLEFQTENVHLCASYGGRIALGSDAGAYRVPHTRGAADEYRYLSTALGAETDRILMQGESEIRERFRIREG